MYSRTATQFDLMMKTIMIVLFVFGLFVFFVDITKAAQWVENPASCATQSPGGEVICQTGETPDSRVCGVNGVQYYCFPNLATYSAPASPATNNASQGSLRGGYIINCEAYDATPVSGPFCDNSGAFWCNASSTCRDSLFRTTTCVAGKWAYESGATTCGDCDASHLDCDAGGDVCEITKHSSTYGAPALNARYGDTCLATDAECKTDYYDCDASNPESGNGCETHQGDSCTTGGGEPGTYNGCTCVVIPPKNFLTASNTTYYSTNPLLWGTQLGSGDLINFGNATSSNIFVVKNDGVIQIGTTTAPVSADNQLYNLNGDLYWAGFKLSSGSSSTENIYYSTSTFNNLTVFNSSTEFYGGSVFYSTSTFEGISVFNSLTEFNSTSTFNSSSIFNDLVFFNSTSTFTGYTIFEGEVVMSTTTISDLTVTGTSTLNNLYVNNIAIFDGPSYFNNDVFVSGTISSTNLYVTGSTTLNDIYVIGQAIFHDILPETTLTYNIGSSSAIWKEGWFEKIFIDEVSFTNNWKLTTTTDGGLAFTSSTQVALAMLSTGQIGINTTTVEANLQMKVDGNVGSRQYCDINGENCFDPIFGWAYPQAVYSTTTPVMFQGDLSTSSLVGYQAGDNICKYYFGSSYHMCSTEDVFNIIHTQDLTQFIVNDSEGWVANGPPGYVANSNDCAGWTVSSSLYYGAYWSFNQNGGGQGKLTTCNLTRPISCCK